MGWFWSPSKFGFFHDAVNVPGCANPVPDDAVPITEQEHLDLLAGQAGGFVNGQTTPLKRIVTGAGGKPVLENYTLPPLAKARK
jgi:hypothetical protein